MVCPNAVKLNDKESRPIHLTRASDMNLRAPDEHGASRFEPNWPLGILEEDTRANLHDALARLTLHPTERGVIHIVVNLIEIGVVKDVLCF